MQAKQAANCAVTTASSYKTSNRITSERRWRQTQGQNCSPLFTATVKIIQSVGQGHGQAQNPTTQKSPGTETRSKTGLSIQEPTCCELHTRVNCSAVTRVKRKMKWLLVRKRESVSVQRELSTETPGTPPCSALF